MIKIEITDLTADQVRALFYYEVSPTDYIPSSADQNRIPEGTRLSAQEIQDIKDGRLIEYIFIQRNKGKDLDKIQSDLEKEYTKEAQNARNKYISDFSGVGSAWDGAVWS